ncbi:MAG: hypothetical protein KDI15_11595, partial [Thiothrix sp.]|nr:hypothetical protein [Thiothrix sp.]
MRGILTRLTLPALIILSPGLQANGFNWSPGWNSNPGFNWSNGNGWNPGWSGGPNFNWGSGNGW